jgi:hypothetical protein
VNIDFLIESIGKISDQKEIQGLAAVLTEWKHDKTTVLDLRDKIEKYLGNIWVEKAEKHQSIYSLWKSFRDTAINNIGGMTMNERLYIFGLFDTFDNCETDEERQQIYKKLLAEPASE